MVKLNIEIEISEEEYKWLLMNLKDVSGNESKKDLENFIGDGLEYDIMKNNSRFLFD